MNKKSSGSKKTIFCREWGDCYILWRVQPNLSFNDIITEKITANSLDIYVKCKYAFVFKYVAPVAVGAKRVIFHIFSWYILSSSKEELPFSYDRERETWAQSQNFSSWQQIMILRCYKNMIYSLVTARKICNSYQIVKGHPCLDENRWGNLHVLCVQSMSNIYLTTWTMLPTETGQIAVFIHCWWLYLNSRI